MKEELVAQKEYMKKLDGMVDTIRTREDLAEALLLMREGYLQGFFYEGQKLEEFLEKAAGFILSLDQICKNLHEPYPEHADWRWVGETFLAAFESNNITP